MKKFKKILLTILVIVLVLLIAYIGLTIWMNRDKLPREVAVSEQITTEWLENEVLSIAEYATLDYRYTNISSFENTLDFYGWKLPFTNKSFMIKYDGSMKLGIDGNQVKVTITDDVIQIHLPASQVLSHVIEEDSIQVFDQSRNIFNPIKVEDYASFAVEQKMEMESKAFTEGVFLEANQVAEGQIRHFLENLPGIKGEYSISFTNDLPQPPMFEEDENSSVTEDHPVETPSKVA